MNENFSLNTISKFQGLINHLTRSTKCFEIIADEVEEYNLKTAFDGLSEESLRYATELSSQLRAFGIKDDILKPCDHNLIEEEDADDYCNEKGEELMSICMKIENYITRAYKDLLNSQLTFPGLKEVMSYQLNSLIFSFTKIKMLNLTRFSYSH